MMVFLIEINAIPGCSQNSFIPKMFIRADLDFSELLKFWIKKELT